MWILGLKGLRVIHFSSSLDIVEETGWETRKTSKLKTMVL